MDNAATETTDATTEITEHAGSTNGDPLVDIIDNLGLARRPLHRRIVELEVYEHEPDPASSSPPGVEADRGVPDFEIVARLRDERPWAEGTGNVSKVHDMEFRVTVRGSDLTITAARADMARFPHAECPQIQAVFGHLVGLQIGRGYTRAVQERFGRALGCTHLEFLARAIGPVVVQAIPSAAAHAGRTLDSESTAWLTDTCHVWATGGPGSQKLEIGWRPGGREYPAPAAGILRHRLKG